MTAQSDPYVRVYYRIIDDPKFESVYDNDAALATWMRLLLAADAMYPSPAHLPRGIRPAALRKLIEAELIDLMPGDKFRLHGLEAERGRRRNQAQKAARKRWDADGDADAPAMHEQSASNAQAMHSEPSLATPSHSEPSQAKPPELHASELPDESDSATLACRQLFDSGKWLGNREYVTAWEEMDRRYSPEWVQVEIPLAFADCLERRGKVLPWDLRRMTEQRLAERSRADEKVRETASLRAVKEREPVQRSDISPEERERQSLFRRAIGIWMRGGRKGKVPEHVNELRDWITANEQGAHP